MKEKGLLKTGALWCLLFAMAFMFKGAAFARTTGSIELQLPQKEAEGVELTLYQVAELENEGYIFCKEFADIGLVITNLSDAAQAQEMADKFANYALEKGLEGNTGKVGEDGTLCFTELPLGLYLAVQTDGQKLLKVQSSFVPVPHVAEAQAEPVYDVVISLKYTFPGGAVIATKVDENGKALGQAHFTLQRKTYLEDGGTAPEGVKTERDKEGIFYWKEYQADLVSNENGQIVLADLPKGVYRFVETKAPSGFVCLEQPQEFTVESPGEVVEVGGIYEEESGTVTKLSIINRATTLKINKVDTSGNPVSGARLVIKNADGKVIVDKNGDAVYAFTSTSQPYELKGLPAGEYYLSEIQAPEGYKVAQDVRVTLSDEAGVVNEVIMVDEPVKPDEPCTEPSTEPSTQPPTEPAAPQSGKVIVTKELVDLQGKTLNVQEAVFYVSLFEDEARTKRVSDVKEIRIRKGAAGTAVFENLDLDKTYYAGETDQYGQLLTNGAFGSSSYTPEYPNGYEVKLTSQNTTGSVLLKNVFDRVPDEPQSESETETEGSGGSGTPGGNSGSPKGNMSSSGSSVKTGDDTPIMLYVGLLAAAALVIIVLVWKKAGKSK